MSGPPTVRVAEVRSVVAGGSPAMDAPAGTAAPASRPLYPRPTAGPPWSWKSTRGLLTAVVLARCGSPVTFPEPGALNVPAPTIDWVTVNAPVGGFCRIWAAPFTTGTL